MWKAAWVCGVFQRGGENLVFSRFFSVGEYNECMRYKRQHAGKWVAVKEGDVIAMAKEFAPLQKKIAARKDAATIRFSLVPSGMITGVL